MIEPNFLLILKYGEEKNIAVEWLEISLQGEQWCRVWVVRLHLHGQGLTPTSQEIAVALSLHCLPDSLGSLQFWELVCVDGNLFSSSWDLVNIFKCSGQSRWSPVSPCCILSAQLEQPLLGRGYKAVVTGVVASAWKLLSCSWDLLCFVLPPLPVFPPLPFLCAQEQRKNNFLCNLAPGNPIPDKL